MSYNFVADQMREQVTGFLSPVPNTTGIFKYIDQFTTVTNRIKSIIFIGTFFITVISYIVLRIMPSKETFGNSRMDDVVETMIGFKGNIKKMIEDAQAQARINKEKERQQLEAIKRQQSEFVKKFFKKK